MLLLLARFVAVVAVVADLDADMPDADAVPIDDGVRANEVDLVGDNDGRTGGRDSREELGEVAMERLRCALSRGSVEERGGQPSYARWENGIRRKLKAVRPSRGLEHCSHSRMKPLR